MDGATLAQVHHLLATAPGEGRWTIRKLAAATGLSRSSVHRVLRGVTGQLDAPR